MRYGIDYQGRKIYVELDEPPKKGICEACHRKVGKDIKITATHHFSYSFSKKQIEKDPKLALKNTAEVCFSCHRYGNALMNLLSVKLENIGDVVNVCKLMPPPMKLKLDALCERWVRYREKEGIIS